MSTVFVTGGTGYIGSRLIAQLVPRGHRVVALTRSGSEGRLPAGCEAVTGNALDASTFAHLIPPGCTFVQLVGVPHPSPAKAKQFREIDLPAALAGISAAQTADVSHFVYVSVAQPAPAMKAYLEVRAEAEAALRASGLNATILRPWYVLGPGHRWPYFLIPFYWFAGIFPPTREGARRLGLVTIKQMLAALVISVEHPAEGQKMVTVPDIKRRGAEPA
jgi:uncharacterized protein YbjT (DUF2867 family)